MSNFNRYTRVRSTIRRAKKLNKQIEAIKNSNLSDEEKEKALNCLKKMFITTVIVVILMAILITIAILIGISRGGNAGAMIMVTSLVVMIVALIGYALIARKIFKDFAMYYDKVDNGFDGLDEQEINRLKPNTKEEALIKKYKAKSVLYTFLLVLALGLTFSIIMKLELSLNSPITYIITIIIIIVWFVYEDTCRVEIHRIKSGRYKRDFGFRCKKCKTTLLIQYSDIEKYLDAPTNEYGIRVTPCQNCNNLITLYNLDEAYDDYKNYLERTK